MSQPQNIHNESQAYCGGKITMLRFCLSDKPAVGCVWSLGSGGGLPCGVMR
jgi:hypothetical protein